MTTDRLDWMWNDYAIEAAREHIILERIRARLKRADERNAMWSAVWDHRQKLEHFRASVSDECAPWFAQIAPGPYGVRAIGPAGMQYDAPFGFHYPYQAIAAAERFKAENPDLIVDAINVNDPESSVYAEDEAYA